MVQKKKDEIEYEEVEYYSHERANTAPPAFTRLEPVEGEVIHLPEFCGEDERLQLGTIAIAYARDQPGREIVDLPDTRYSRAFLMQCLDALSRPDERAQYDTGRLIIQEESGDLWQIESYNDCLMGDIEIVVRTQALRDLDRSLAQKFTGDQEKPPTTRQRRTLLTIIAAICDYSDIKPNAREAAGQIASMTDEIGASVTAETIRELLKEIPQALEARKK